MARTCISLIGELYDCVNPLFSGAIQPDGIDLAVTRSPSPEAMRRQLTAWEFDICEMAFGAYLIARSQGADVTAIPVFPRRAFFHTNFMCHGGAGINSPHGLAGKRIGVAEYVQSATLWARGVLEHDFSLDPRNAQWYVERSGSGSTGEVLGFKPPGDIAVQQTPAGKSSRSAARGATVCCRVGLIAAIPARLSGFRSRAPNKNVNKNKYLR